jgi:carboxyl-terminal processing protease
MKPKVLIYIFSVLAVLILLAGTCSASFIIGRLTAPRTSSAFSLLPVVTTTAQSDTQALFAPFWEAWNIVHTQYITQPVNDEQLMQGAIRGMISSLGDEHSSYMDPVEYNQASTVLMQGEYEGIGAWVNTTVNKYLTINRPMPGSPAEKAGLKPGDQIIAIDGQDMTGISPEVARSRVIGPKGTTVRLTILREGETKPFDVEIHRASITVPTVETKMLDNKIAYISLYDFGEKTPQQLRDALTILMKQDPKGIILDVRNNLGGLLTTAIEVASEFIGDGTVMFEKYGNGQQETFTAQKGGLATKIPLVVLINQYSASASEIVAGAVQDRGRGSLVGVTSFGKGTVQVWSPLSNNQGAVRITVAQWMTPNGTNVTHVGLKPDVEVKMTEEDIKANRDPQLDKAVELLTQK